MEKSSLTTWPGQHRSCAASAAAGQVEIFAIPLLWLPQEFCYRVLCVHLGAGTNTGKPAGCSHLKILPTPGQFRVTLAICAG